MKLYGSLTSPFVRKIRVQLLEKQIPFEFILENVWESDTRIMDHNPLGKIPCLKLDNGQAVFDSTVISGMLEYMIPTIPLLPADPHERALVRTMESLGTGLNDAAVAILLEHRFHPGEAASAEWLQRQYQKIEQSLEWLSAHLQASPGEFLTPHFCLADVSVGCALLYLEFRRPEVEWRSRFPGLSAYADRLAARPSFEATKPPV